MRSGTNDFSIISFLANYKCVEEVTPKISNVFRCLEVLDLEIWKFCAVVVVRYDNGTLIFLHSCPPKIRRKAFIYFENQEVSLGVKFWYISKRQWHRSITERALNVRYDYIISTEYVGHFADITDDDEKNINQNIDLTRKPLIPKGQIGI